MIFIFFYELLLWFTILVAFTGFSDVTWHHMWDYVAWIRIAVDLEVDVHMELCRLQTKFTDNIEFGWKAIEMNADRVDG